MNGPSKQLKVASISTGRPRLLLAEDEPSVADFLREILHATYEVEVATEGEQAWQAVWERPPDLLLSDVRMPGVDGIELTRRMRAHPRTAPVPVILLTASNEAETARQGQAAGASGFLLKPFRPAELLAVLAANAPGAGRK